MLRAYDIFDKGSILVTTVHAESPGQALTDVAYSFESTAQEFRDWGYFAMPAVRIVEKHVFAILNPDYEGRAFESDNTP